MTETNIAFRNDPEVEQARRIAFVLSQAEDQLGIRNVKDLPLSARVENVLQGAMHDPTAVDEGTFAILHGLASTAATQENSADVE